MSDVLELKNKKYVVSQDLEDLAKKVIADKHLDIDQAKIKYVLVYPAISKKLAGRCVLSNPMLKLFGECDYIIQMSGDLWDKLDDARKEILMWHELMHVLPVQNTKTGNLDFKLRDHDVKDFIVIIKQYGIDWLSEVKALFASVYNLEPKDLDGFEL